MKFQKKIMHKLYSVNIVVMYEALLTQKSLSKKFTEVHFYRGEFLWPNLNMSEICVGNCPHVKRPNIQISIESTEKSLVNVTTH